MADKKNGVAGKAGGMSKMEAVRRALGELAAGRLRLKMITNRGVKVFPDGLPETLLTDHWRCRFVAREGQPAFADVLDLLARIDRGGFEVIKTEHLYAFDGQPAYSLGQGE